MNKKLILDTFLNPIHSSKHKCQLNAKLDVMQDVYPKNNLKHKFLRFFYRLLLSNQAIEKHRRVYNSQYTLYEGHKIQLRAKCFIIHPDSVFYLIWKCIMYIESIYVLIVFPFIWSISSLEFQPDLFHTLMACSEIFAIIDIIMNFFIIVYDEEDVMHCDLKYIAKRYLCKEFIVDIMSAMPINLFCEMYSDNSFLFYKSTFYHIFALLKVLRFPAFVTSTYNILKTIINKESILIFLLAHIGIIVFVHWGACTYTVASALDAEIGQKRTSNLTNWLLYDDRWNYRNKSSIFYVYGLAIYMLALDKAEMKFLYIPKIDSPHHNPSGPPNVRVGKMEMLVSFSVKYAFKIACLIYIYVTFRAYKIYYKKEGTHKKLKQAVQIYLQNVCKDAIFKKRVVLFFEERFCEKSLIDRKITREIITLRAFELLKSMELFYNFPEAILLQLASSLILEFYFPGDIINTEREDKIALSFILYGSFAFYYGNGQEITHLEDGDYVGICNIFPKVPIDYIQNKYGVAVEICNVFHLPMIIFKKFVQSYPLLLQRVTADYQKIHGRDMRYSKLLAQNQKNERSYE